MKILSVVLSYFMGMDRVSLTFNIPGMGGCKSFTAKCRQPDFNLRVTVFALEKFDARPGAQECVHCHSSATQC
jgi:hypothetical protein